MKKLLFGILGLLVTISGWSAETDSGPISSVTVAGLVAQNGTPSPTNPAAIQTNNGVLKVSKNLFDENMETGTLSSVNGAPAAMGTRLRSADFTKVEPNTTYTLSADTSGKIKRGLVFLYDTSGSMVGYGRSNNYEALPYTFNTKANTAKIKIVLTAADDSTNLIPSDAQKIQLELGSTATPYMPYGEIYTDGEVETIADSANHTANVATLLGVGDYRDTQNINTGAITRRVGVKVFDGTENWQNLSNYFNISKTDIGSDSTVLRDNGTDIFCSHFETKTNAFTDGIGVGTSYVNFKYDSITTTLAGWKQWLADQYAAGTPVIIVYPLATETTESVAGQTMTTAPVSNKTGGVTGMTITTLLSSGASVVTTIAANAIKIATTAYNSARFSPVVTELNDTIATIRSVVTNTINQTKAIADLQATKQTRPDETCPAGKKCLLVEDNAGTPHWFEIVESAD